MSHKDTKMSSNHCLLLPRGFVDGTFVARVEFTDIFSLIASLVAFYPALIQKTRGRKAT
jgi:hypothetical protein